MTNMFTNYENDLQNKSCFPHFHKVPDSNPKILTNIKGKMLGVQVDHSSPLQLYFHLENTCEVENLEALIQGTTVFEILTTTHKIVAEHEYQTAEILDQNTNDLYIFLSQEEMKNLKKETYNMRVTLKTANAEYVIFKEKDGYLVIR